MPAYTVQQEMILQVSPEDLFAHVRNFHHWPIWSPWTSLDPDIELSISDSGESYSWKSDLVGIGSIELSSEVPGSELRHRLRFEKPFKAECSTHFSFHPHDAACLIRWRMEGSLPFFLFWMKQQMVCGMEMDFQRGLLRLKSLVETGQVPSHLSYPGEEQLPAQPYFAMERRCAMSEIGDMMPKDFAALHEEMQRRKLEATGPAFCSYLDWSATRKECVYRVCMPLNEPLEDAQAPWVSATRPAARCFRIRHEGAYPFLGDAWAAGFNRIRGGSLKQNKSVPPFEVYERMATDEAELSPQTLIHFPIR